MDCPSALRSGYLPGASHTISPCFYTYAEYGGSSSCPLGWGSYSSYTSYLPGCSCSRYYPSPIPAYSGPSYAIGSLRYYNNS